MTKILSYLSAKASIIGAMLVALLIAIAVFFKERSDKWKKRAKQAEADLEFQDDIRTLDAQIEHSSDEKKKKLNQEKETLEWPSNLRRK